jgi:hypothetical protein
VTWGFTDQLIQVGLNHRENLPDNTPTFAD